MSPAALVCPRVCVVVSPGSMARCVRSPCVPGGVSMEESVSPPTSATAPQAGPAPTALPVSTVYSFNP